MSEESEVKPANNNMKIVGINLGILVVYTVFSRFTGEGGIIIDAFFIFFHVIICIILAIAARKWSWLLSGVLVLVIGFSTCTSFLTWNMH